MKTDAGNVMTKKGSLMKFTGWQWHKESYGGSPGDRVSSFHLCIQISPACIWLSTILLLLFVFLCYHVNPHLWWPHKKSALQNVLFSRVLYGYCTLKLVVSFMESIHLILVFLFTCCLQLFPVPWPFPQNTPFSWCGRRRTISVSTY